MQSFIITFYRSGGKSRSGLVIGTFADPARGGERNFTSLTELHQLVDEAVAGWERGKRKRTKKEEL
jgi:hypothetical protein